jgi:hypothetical protein
MFNKIVEFFTGKKPEAAPAAPYKVEVTPVVEAAPAPVAAIVPDAVIITSDAVAPTLVVDTIVTEPTQPEVAAPKSTAKRGPAKVTAKPKSPAVPTKAPRKSRSKKV